MLRFQGALFLLSSITGLYALPEGLDLQRRGNSDAPDGYAPASVPCPDVRPAVRPANTLSPQEAAWLEKKDENTFPVFVDMVKTMGIRWLDVGRYLRNLSDSGGQLPRLGIAVSGGGYRAMMNGAGALAAFDNRTPGTAKAGGLGGILQAATYISGLSGGSWLVGSLYTQNFTTVGSIIDATEGGLSQLWQFNDSVFHGPDTLRPGEYYRELTDSVDAKLKAGFNTSITDFWGRALSYQLVNATDGGPGYTYSSIATDDWFNQAQAPLPIVVAVERSPGMIQIQLNSTVIEFNPWEMGSYDGPTRAFVPLKYVGSSFENGEIPPNGECIAGVDNLGFVVGTSSSLFNQGFLQISQVEGVPDNLIDFINNTLAQFSDENRDVAVWPNPFFQYNNPSNPNADSEILTLVDGGEGLENIPFHPLLWEARKVDAIIAIDSSSDTPTHWPNGTAMVATYQKSLLNNDDTMAGFPAVPDQNTFINLQLNNQPTFFGCELSNMTKPGPLIIYLPNAPYSTFSNASTFDLSFTTEQRDANIENGFNVATRGNNTLEANWNECLTCAVLRRSFQRTGYPMPPVCAECFTKHCWTGEIMNSEPEIYNPTQIINGTGTTSDGARNAVAYFGGVRADGLGYTGFFVLFVCAWVVFV